MTVVGADFPTSGDLFFGVSEQVVGNTVATKDVSKLSIALFQLRDLFLGVDPSDNQLIGALRVTTSYWSGTSVLKAPWKVLNIKEAVQQGYSELCRLAHIIFSLGDSLFNAIGFYEVLSKGQLIGDSLGSIQFFGNTISLTAYNLADLSICLSFVFDSVDLLIGTFQTFSKGKVCDLFHSKVVRKLLLNGLRIAVLTTLFLGYGSSYWWFVTLKILVGVVKVCNIMYAFTEKKLQETIAIQQRNMRTARIECKI